MTSFDRIEKHGNALRRLAEFLAFTALLLLTIFLLFHALGDASFHDDDEALYAQIALEMQSSGDWLTLHYLDEPFLHKPPLVFWLMALAGRSLPGYPPELHARLPSALASLLLVVLVYWTTRRLAGPWAGLGGALALLSNGQFLFEHSARSANLDAPLNLLCFAVLAFGALARRHTWARFVSALALSGVAMTKAPIAAFPFAAVLVFLWTRDRRVARTWLAWVAGTGLLLVLPWHLYQLWAHGRPFWDVYVELEILGRASTTASVYSGQPLVHLEALLRSFLPWSPLIVLTTLAALVYWPKHADDHCGHKHDVCRMFAGFSTLYFVVLCFIPGKWPWYVLVIQPAMAVVGAAMVADLARGRAAALLAPTVALLAAGRVVLVDPVASYAPAARPSFFWPNRLMMGHQTGWPTTPELIVAALFLAAGALVLISTFRQSRRLTAALVGVLVIATVAIGIRTVLSVPLRHESAVHGLARTLARQGVVRVYLLGFLHEERYGGRLTPMAGVYLRNIPGATTIDCDMDLGCVMVATGRSAVVVHARGARAFSSNPQFARLLARSDLDIWSLSDTETTPIRPRLP